MRLAVGAVIATLASGAALAQTPDSFTCGSFKAVSWRTSSANGPITHWTVERGPDKTTEMGVLRSAPRFECLDNAVLMLEVTFAAGNGTFAVYFPDGNDLAYGRQQIDTIRHDAVRLTVETCSGSCLSKARVRLGIRIYKPTGAGCIAIDEDHTSFSLAK